MFNICVFTASIDDKSVVKLITLVLGQKMKMVFVLTVYSFSFIPIHKICDQHDIHFQF